MPLRCYDSRTTKVRIEHELRLLLRGDSTVDQTSDRIMILVQLWDMQNAKEESSKGMRSLRSDGGRESRDNRGVWLSFKQRLLNASVLLRPLSKRSQGGDAGKTEGEATSQTQVERCDTTSEVQTEAPPREAD